MALRIRRGTQAERDDPAFIPDSGEPVWTIDTKRLYIGDGVTEGGNLITASGGGSTAGIVSTATGTIITLSDLVATFDVDVEMGAAADITLSSTSQLNGTGQISLTGNITGNDFSGNAATFASVTATGGLTGDLKGSVFGDDSSLIVDANNGVINTNFIHFDGELEVANQTAAESTVLKVESDTASSILKLLYTSDSDLGSATAGFGTVLFNRQDPINGEVSTGFISAGNYGIYIGVEETGSVTETETLTWTNTGRLGIGRYLPNAELEVVGDAIVTGNLTAGAMLLSGSNIDTSDSSGITVTPGVTMSSDLTVENNLVVNNTLVCDTLEVTNFTTAGAGTPELTSDTAILLTAGTRVEVTSSPFKLASFTDAERDALSAENGDMIYNTDNNRPEMYVNGAWKIVDTSPIV